MDDFTRKQRDPFITEEGAKQLLDFERQALVDPEIDQIMSDPEVDLDRKYKISKSRSSAYLQITLLLYSIGSPIEEVKESGKHIFIELDRHFQVYGGTDDDKYSLSENNGYQYSLWLLGLAYLLGLDEYIPKIASWISPAKRDGHDPLFAALFEKLGLPEALPSTPNLLHPKGYANLWEVVRQPSDCQTPKPQLMQSYIRGWYKDVIGKTVWKGWDEKGWIYFGLWSLEAGLVTVLYGLEDSLYRDMTFYPKDLVIYARQQRALTKATRLTQTQVRGGEKATHTGYWVCPNMLENDPRRRQFFNQGDILPKGESTKGSYVWHYQGEK